MSQTFLIAMKRFIATIFILSAALQIKAQNIQERIIKLAEGDAISQSAVSICAIKGDGQKIVDINSSMMLVPASNMKLLSTGAAIHHFGPEYRFETSLAHDGTIADGLLNGNLYIMGGGDPTLGSTDSIAPPIEETFSQWLDMLKEAGISQINGKIIGDGNYFDAMIEQPTWLVEDVGTYYGAGTTGLMFYENMQSFRVSAGAEIGDSVNIAPSYPEVPWMEFRYNCTTGGKGTGDQLFMFTSELAPVAEIRGTFGVDRAAKRLDCSNKFPEYTCAYYFQEFLKRNGVECTGIGDFRLDKDWERNGDLSTLGTTLSPQLKRIVFETNHISNNVFAETLLRTLGREMTGSACYDSSYVAINNVMTGLGVDTTRGARIKAKSGSMNGVRCYSGYIIPTDGSREDVIIFSLMINNCTASSTQMRNILDSMMAELAAEN